MKWWTHLRMPISELTAAYRDAVILLAGTCAIVVGALIDGVTRPIMGFYASMALSAMGFIGAGYIAALVFKRVVSRGSMNCPMYSSVSDEEAGSDLIGEVAGQVRHGVFGVVCLLCMIATIANIRVLFMVRFDPHTLAAVAGTASWSIVAFVGVFSLNLVGRKALALALIIGNLLCLLLALISFILVPSGLAAVVAAWCAALVILPLLKIRLWWINS